MTTKLTETTTKLVKKNCIAIIMSNLDRSIIMTVMIYRWKLSKDRFLGRSPSLLIIYVYFLTLSVSFEEEHFSIKTELKKINWVIGSPPILYKLVLGPMTIVHTNFQENPLTTLGISRHFKII